MSQPNVGDEFAKAVIEPLLPIEKKLVAWSLVTGIALLLILGLAGKYIFPV